MKKSFVNKLAFTLVELVVVIAILGILGTAAGLAIGSAKKNADRKQALTKLRSYYEICITVMTELNSGFSMVDGRDIAGVATLLEQRTGTKPIICNLITSCAPSSPTPPSTIIAATTPKYDSQEGFYVLYRFCDPNIEDHSTPHSETMDSDKSFFVEQVWYVKGNVVYEISRHTSEPAEHEEPVIY